MKEKCSIEDRTWQQERRDVVADLRGLAEQYREHVRRVEFSRSGTGIPLDERIRDVERDARTLDDLADRFHCGIHIGASEGASE